MYITITSTDIDWLRIQYKHKFTASDANIKLITKNPQLTNSINIQSTLQTELKNTISSIDYLKPIKSIQNQ